MRMNFSVPVTALVAGLALGYFLKSDTRTSSVPEVEEEVKSTPIADVGEAESLKALRKRIAELESQLAAKTDTEEKKVEERGPGKGGPFDFREQLEEMTKENPAQYAQITNGMAQMRKMRKERSRTKKEFFASIDTSKMTAEQKENHDKLQALIDRREAIEEKMHDDSLSNEDRRKLFEEMMEASGELHAASMTERETLFRQTASALGFEGEDADEIVSTIGEIISATGDGFGRGPGPGGPGGPRGPGGAARGPSSQGR